MIDVVTWNIHGGKTPGGDSYDFAGELSRFEADVVALQEIDVPRDQADSAHARELRQRTRYDHVIVASLSESHHDPSARLGIALLSRIPFNQTQLVSLPNPNLRNASGEISHDRAVLKASITVGDLHYEIACVHMVSFFHFGVYNEAHRFTNVWTALSRALSATRKGVVSIAMGDFNSHKRYELIEQLRSETMRSSFFFHPSKISRAFDDDILVSSSLVVTELDRITTSSDHDLLHARIALAEDASRSHGP
jgi:endonuclease/exonuclease/phosphatase family metal-dependent hydrolase